MKELIRKYKIALCLGKPLTKELQAIGFIQSVLDKIECKTSDKFPNRILYCIGNTIYFNIHEDEQKRHDEWLICNTWDFFIILQTDYSLDRSFINKIIKYMLGTHIKQETGIPTRTIDFV